MATAVLAPYSHSHFQRLPDLEDAKAKFLSDGNGEQVVHDFFKNFFVKNGMDRTFGLAMLHRHFNLEPDEKLVDYRGTSTPWSSTRALPGMREPQAAIWAFDDDGTLKPTEFHYSETQDLPLSLKALEFAAKLQAELDSRGLTKVLGLARYPGDDFEGSCEITVARTNINLQPNDYPTGLKSVPTIWFFSTPLWTRGCKCLCGTNDKGDHAHSRHYITTSG